jgi:hypothetical protein
MVPGGKGAPPLMKATGPMKGSMPGGPGLCARMRHTEAEGPCRPMPLLILSFAACQGAKHA